MTLPGAERAFIDPRKVRDYLLNPSHREGHSKARFFNWLGYTRAKWPRLYETLLEVAVRGEAVMTELTTYGQKWEVHATIK
jgi:hypothetical protein